MSASLPAEVELPDLVIRTPRELERWLQLQGVTIEELRGPDRHRPLVTARRIVAAYLHRRGWSSVMIGRYLGRDHTTILHHLKRPNSLEL